VALIALFLLVHEQSDYVIYGGISILASSASNIMNFFHLRHYVSLRPVGNYNFKKHLKMVIVFFAMSIATTIYTHLDTVMLGFMKTDTDVGYYSAAVKIKTILVSMVTSASSVLLPRMTFYVENRQKDEFYKIAKKTMNLIFLVAVPFMVYFILYAKEGIFFLSGDAYAGAIVPMQIIMPTLLLIGMSNILGIQIMVPIGKELQVLYSEIAGAVVDLIINILLIPRYGAAGAAIGTLVAEAVVLVFQIFAIRDISFQLLKAVRYKVLIISVALAAVASIWVKGLQLNSFFTLVISACIFFGVYLVVEVLFKESLILELLKQVLEKIRGKKGR
jgi:O-antigen/teichoic acid export membrane protein